MAAPELLCADSPDLEALREENELLRQEIRVARRAGDVANELVAKQFVEVERILGLFEAENTLRKAILDATQLSIIYTDLNGTVRLFNRGAEQLLGYEAPEMEGSGNLLDIHLENELAARRTELGGSAGSGLGIFMQLAQRGLAQTREWNYVRKDGACVPVNLSVTGVLNPEGALIGLLCSAMDLSELKRHEAELRREKDEQQALLNELQTAHQQLVQSEKMAGIGQLAAGVAHEINNPIGFVNSNLEVLKEYMGQMLRVIEAYERIDNQLQAAPELRREIEAVKAEAELGYVRNDAQVLIEESLEGLSRVKRIVQDLRDFSRMGDLSWEWSDLHAGLDSTLNVVGNEIRYKAVLRKEYGQIPQVRCMPAQLNQVFMNLLVNAAQAIESKGEITVTTRVQGDGVAVTVADTGKGIPPENLKKIFDPFFTTKPVGQGTGLGLYISFGVVRKHHGRIEVRSEVGKGTAFTVWLPVDQPANS